jgi:starch synthase
MKILMATSECAPFGKTGGLGDMVPGLAKALARAGHEVRIIMPYYAALEQPNWNAVESGSACIHMGNGVEQWVGVREARLDGLVTVWMVECAQYFSRPGIYHEKWGEYPDNPYRFGLLSKAVLQICLDKGFVPEVIHAHDWPTALVPVFLKTWERVFSPLSATASVLTLHNIGYQGKYPAGVFPYFGIGGEHFHPGCFEDYGGINLMKAGIHFADALTTVSPTHAREILDPIGGQGLAPYLSGRSQSLFGILNGADYELWNPETDPLIPACYDAENLEGKTVCKRALQVRLGLEETPEVPLFGIISRFARQKGFDLLEQALPRVMDTMSAQVAVLGTGDSGTEAFFRGLQARYPGRVAAHIGFSEELSHGIEAGSDFFLMPSHYEPCGLNQIYSLKYGTLPVVRATGGLEDTIENYDEADGSGTGFKFLLPEGGALCDTIGWAVSTWYDRPRHLELLRRRAMAQHFGWEDSARRYLEVYRHGRHNRLALLALEDPAHGALRES